MSRWIESHQALLLHPKLFRLVSLSGLSQDVCIAKLHRLWWWALQYAEDGYLDRYSAEEIAIGIGFDDLEAGNKFFSALCNAKWIDEHKRINDWLDYAERYLKSKYRTANPLKYQAIIDKWLGQPKGQPKGQPLVNRKRKLSPSLDGQPNLTKPNLTKPNLTKHNPPAGVSAEIWEMYLNHRKNKRATITKDAYKLICQKLNELQKKGMDADKVLMQSIEQGWTGIFELKGAHGGSSEKPQTTNHGQDMLQVMREYNAKKP